MVNQEDSYYKIPEKCKGCGDSFPHYKGEDKVAWCDRHDVPCHHSARLNCPGLCKDVKERILKGLKSGQ
jgi:hypothetical protein